MKWKITSHPAFKEEFHGLSGAVQDAILAKVGMLAEFGPKMRRPLVDSLNASKFPNMKELRCNADNGVWRIAFAFDPERNAVLLVAGDKVGINEKRFYKRLIAKADERFEQHLVEQKRRMR